MHRVGSIKSISNAIASEECFRWNAPVLSPFPDTILHCANDWPDHKKYSFITTSKRWFCARYISSNLKKKMALLIYVQMLATNLWSNLIMVLLFSQPISNKTLWQLKRAIALGLIKLVLTLEILVTQQPSPPYELVWPNRFTYCCKCSTLCFQCLSRESGGRHMQTGNEYAPKT